MGGAEKLLGSGDMLFAPNRASTSRMRVQGAWVSDEEVHASWSTSRQRHDTDYDEDVIEHMNRPDDGEAPDPGAEKEEDSERVRPAAARGGGDRRSRPARRPSPCCSGGMRVGYARAGRLIDDMAERGVVSQSEGAKPRQVLMTREQYNALYGDNKQ